MKYESLEEWLAEGARRFGPDQLKWKFQCPACGHIQAVEDFRPYKDRGVTAETARFNCIGRYMPKPREAFSTEGNGPCDYTSGGLFDLRPDIIMHEGDAIKSFAFAPADEPESSK